MFEKEKYTFMYICQEIAGEKQNEKLLVNDKTAFYNTKHVYGLQNSYLFIPEYNIPRKEIRTVQVYVT